jgi:Domain of unknown function (DUF3883)
MGSPVEAAHRHVRDFNDGSEKYNFLPGPDGRFYAYTPPLGKTVAAPKPKVLEGWLVFSVAKQLGENGLLLTGWYEDATFAGGFIKRPEYGAAKQTLPLDENNEPYYYTFSAPRAVHVDPRVNRYIFSGDHMRRAPIFYLKGNGLQDRWRNDLARRLLKIRQRWNEVGMNGQSPIAGGGRGGICADSKRRKEVEEAAVALVKAKYPEPRYIVMDRQLEKCGFDLLVRTKKSGMELHIEVKGTQNTAPHFLMSHKEYAYMRASPRRWRLAMVTDALSKAPKLELMDAKEAETRFSWKEFTWHAVGT